jgi:hypothetical protein
MGADDHQYDLSHQTPLPAVCPFILCGFSSFPFHILFSFPFYNVRAHAPIVVAVHHEQVDDALPVTTGCVRYEAVRACDFP